MSVAVAMFSGKWKYGSGENHEAFMSAIGVPKELHQFASETVFYIECREEGGVITWATTPEYLGAKHGTVTNVFRIGEEIEEDTGDGKKKKCVYTWDGDKLVSTYPDWDGKGLKVTMSRALEGDSTSTVMSAGDVTCTVVYLRC
ncbi:hypothetical protein Bbelb_128100 [Branchiostoma belcheri]|nr:hypothetical protein Bbelb_128100 [Branchiostoma belcheri]